MNAAPTALAPNVVIAGRATHRVCGRTVVWAAAKNGAPLRIGYPYCHHCGCSPAGYELVHEDDYVPPTKTVAEAV